MDPTRGSQGSGYLHAVHGPRRESRTSTPAGLPVLGPEERWASFLLFPNTCLLESSRREHRQVSFDQNFFNNCNSCQNQNIKSLAILENVGIRPHWAGSLCGRRGWTS